MARLEFWFEFASTYSYLSAMRIEALAEQKGVTVDWKPFLLGPIFAAQGWHTSPFNIYPAKGRYMWRDMERRAAHYGLPFQRPPPDRFPANGLRAARLALVAMDQGVGPAFTRAVYTAQFASGQDISDEDVLIGLLGAVGLDPDTVFAAALAPENKARLRGQTETAIEHGIFGAPSFVVGSELFWGDDRLEDALDWALLHAA